jgi:hypothetical protein
MRKGSSQEMSKSKNFKTASVYIKSRLRKPQQKTNARILAENDPRHVLSFYCMCKRIRSLSAKNTSSIGMQLNSKFRKMKMKMLLLLLNPKMTVLLPLLCQRPQPIFIKYFHFHNAEGNLSPLVFLVADPDLPDNEFVVVPISGMVVIGDISDLGYLVFIKTRCGNKEFFKWFGETIVASFISKCRENYDYRYDNGDSYRSFVTCDGEPIQIEAFQTPHLVNLYEEMEIDLGKISASCSAIANLLMSVHISKL